MAIAKCYVRSTCDTYCRRHERLKTCYTPYVREKEFINKVHKHLPKTIYRWKINDPYHGGVPDTFYSGRNDHCFIEYKYTEKIPARQTSKLKFNLSPQQRIWLNLQLSNNIKCYACLAIKNQVYVTQDFNLEYKTLEEFNDQSITFDSFIEFITDITIGNKDE